MAHTLVFITVVASVFVSPLTGHAHHALGWTYPPACCMGSDVGGDCQRIPGETVTKGRHGFSVVLRPGDHHLVTRDHFFLIPYGDEIPSGDSDFPHMYPPDPGSHELLLRASGRLLTSSHARFWSIGHPASNPSWSQLSFADPCRAIVARMGPCRLLRLPEKCADQPCQGRGIFPMHVVAVIGKRNEP